jgi:hypothetical protein
LVHIPIAVEPEPVDAFREWLLGELATIRGVARG